MPARLQPKVPLAADAILVGDPGRALLLAQALLEQPKMSNHARGLWGYTGSTPAGDELTIQATGMGAPSAAAVLADLAELGVRRAVRVGTCLGLREVRLGELLLVGEAVGAGGSATSFGVEPGAAVSPDPTLRERLRSVLGDGARQATVASLDAMPTDATAVPAGVVAVDMQSVALLARGRQLGVAIAALLVVTETGAGEALGEEALTTAAEAAGKAASDALSP